MRRTLVALLLAACHHTPTARSAPPPQQTPTPAAVAPAPVVVAPSSPRPTHVASPSQATVLLTLGDELITTDMSRRAFLRVPLGGGEPIAIVGAGHYPSRLLADGDDAWIEVSRGHDTVMHVTRAGMHTPIVSSQVVMAIARDETHLYVLSASAPNVRRTPRVDLFGRAVSPDRARDLVEPVAHVADALDLAAVGGDVYVATTTALVRARAHAPSRRLCSLPARPTVVIADGRDIFVGTEEGAVLRVPREGATPVELGRIEGEVASLHVRDCLVFAGGAHSLEAFDRVRGVRVPIASDVAATAVTTSAERVYFTDYARASLLSMPLPACPGESERGGAREVVERATTATVRASVDADPLAGRSHGPLHTAVVRFGTVTDPVGLAEATRLVSRVIASRGGELWARVTDAQFDALREQGHDVALRDGVDRLRCVDVRSNPALARRGPPLPWRAAARPRAHLAQLAAASNAFEDLGDALAQQGATLLEVLEPATLLLDATAAIANRLVARVPAVSFVTPYDARERLLPMTPVTAAAAEAEPRPCEPSPEARLRALAAWIEADPGAPVELSIALFRPSVTVEGIVARSGGSVREGSGTEALGARVPRRALIPLGDADDVRSIEPTAEGSPAAGLPQGP